MRSCCVTASWPVANVSQAKPALAIAAKATTAMIRMRLKLDMVASPARDLFGNDIAMHRRQYRQQTVLRAGRDAAAIHRVLHMLDQRIEVTIMQVKIGVRALH